MCSSKRAGLAHLLERFGKQAELEHVYLVLVSVLGHRVCHVLQNVASPLNDNRNEARSKWFGWKIIPGGTV